MASVVKNSPPNSRDLKDVGSILELGRSHGGGHGNPLQYSCLENPMDKGAWKARVHRVPKSRTWPKWLSTHVVVHLVGTQDIFLEGRKKERKEIKK